MDRQELLQKFLKSMDSMARIGAMHQGSRHVPKDMPPRAQMAALFALSRSGPLSIKDLSQQFDMTSSAATQLVNGLVSGGYVVRTEDPSDRRKIFMTLTKKGEKVMERAKEYRMKKMLEMFKPLTEAELGQLLRIQEKIVEHWETTCKQTKNK